MHIACASDDNFMPHCAAMLHSLLTQHERGSISVHFVHDDEVSAENLANLSGMVKELGAGWSAHRVPDALRQRFPDNNRFGRVAWYRVLLPDLLPEIERVLYLDADTLVMKPLDALWQMDLSGFPLGAVINPLYPFMDETFLGNLGLTPSTYFNSGVLLMDLQQWREYSFRDRVLERALQQGVQEWPDQNALNVVFKEQWLSLEPQWNAQNTLFDLREGQLPFEHGAIIRAKFDPAVVHFIGPYKPWHYRCKHILREQYRRHRQSTPWPEQSLEGNTLRNRIMRLLPEQWGWQLEAKLRRWR